MSAGPFKVGDRVQCVADDVCPYHSRQPDECPEMIGGVFRVVDVDSRAADWEPGCLGYVWLEGCQEWWCVGTLRLIDKADDTFIEQMRSLRPIKEDAPDLLSSEYRPWLDRTADALRKRWDANAKSLANRCATGLSSSTAPVVAALRVSIPFAGDQ